MTVYEFGDVEPDDAYDGDATIAPEQVTHRLHELRTYVETLSGVDVEHWADLTDRERSLAYAIGEAITGWYVAHPAGSALDMAIELHNVRRYFASLVGQVVEPWSDLDDGQRDVAVAVTHALIEWLRAEGPR